MKRKSMGVIAGLVVTIATVVGMSATPASASAIGCNYYKWGQLCVTVGGTRTYVTSVHTAFISTSKRCNWDVSGEFFDVHNQWYMTKRSAIHYGCSAVNFDDVWINSNVQPGFVCSTLRENSSSVASRCESIY